MELRRIVGESERTIVMENEDSRSKRKCYICETHRQLMLRESCGYRIGTRRTGRIDDGMKRIRET